MRNVLLALATIWSVSAAAQSTETRTLSPFHSVEAKGSFNVVITAGTSTTARLEGDAETTAKIDLKVENGKLTISWREQNVRMNWKGQPTVVYVETETLHNLAVSGSGNVTVKGRFKPLGEFNVARTGSGNLRIGVVNATKLNLALIGSGNCSVEEGEASEVNVSLQGSGNLDVSNVQAAVANVVMQGSGNVSIMAAKELNVSAQGSGRVRYKGDPKLQTTSTKNVQKI